MYYGNWQSYTEKSINKKKELLILTSDAFQNQSILYVSLH